MRRRLRLSAFAGASASAVVRFRGCGCPSTSSDPKLQRQQCLNARQTPPQSTEAAARAAGISLGEAQTAQRAHYAVTMAELSQAMDRLGAVVALTNAGPEAYRYWKHLAQEVGRTAEVPPAKACSADSSAPSDQNVSVEPKEETNDGPE